MPPKRKSATAEAEKPAKAVKTTKATKTAKATNASKTTKTETAGKAAKAEKVPKPTSQSGAKKTATKATTKATTSKENNSSRTLNENEAISIHTPEFTMGNKNSTPKEGSVRSRGAKVDNTNGSTYRSTLKDNNNTLGSKQTSKPNTNPSTNSSTKKLFNPERCYSWFKTYTGLEEDEDFDKEKIGPDGISKLCEDINVSLETVDMLVLAYHLEAKTMPIFTKDEWVTGMKKLEIDSTEKLKNKMPSLVAKLKDPQQFKEFYRYIFMFAKDPEQKCMPLETACAMIQTVMKGKPHEKRFVEFLETKKPVRVINKDQWYNFLEFSDTVDEDLSNYDGAISAWPVLLDDYVEWRGEETS